MGDTVFFSPAFGLGTLPSFSIISLILTRYYNVGVDNVLQPTVVLADGSHVTTNLNSYQHPDFTRVVTLTAYKTYPIFSFTKPTLCIKFSSPDIAQDAVSKFIKIHPTLSDAGFNASFALSNSSSKVRCKLLPRTVGGKPALPLLICPVRRRCYSRACGQLEIIRPILQVFKALPDKATGAHVESASRLPPRSLAVSDPQAAKAANILLSAL